MADVDKEGIEVIIQYAIQYLCQRSPGRPIHVSFDVDALDDLEVPCTGTPGNLNKTVYEIDGKLSCINLTYSSRWFDPS